MEGDVTILEAGTGDSLCPWSDDDYDDKQSSGVSKSTKYFVIVYHYKDGGLWTADSTANILDEESYSCEGQYTLKHEINLNDI
jgi:hypothetical protein